MKLCVLLVVLVAIMATSTTFAAGNVEGWKVVFTIDGSSGDVTVGANDNGSGYDIYGITGPVSAYITGGYGSKIRLDSMAQFVEPIEYFGSSTNPAEYFTLRWTTYTWDHDWLYRPADLPARYGVWGHGVGSILDLSRSGSKQVHWGDGCLTVVTQPVPEPTGFLALGAGCLGLAGLVRRKH